MDQEISCQRAGIDCEFLIQSDDIPEVVDLVQKHCSEQHDVDASTTDLREQSVGILLEAEAFVGILGRTSAVEQRSSPSAPAHHHPAPASKTTHGTR